MFKLDKIMANTLQFPLFFLVKLLLLLSAFVSLRCTQPTPQTSVSTEVKTPSFYIDTLSERTFNYFWETANESTYLVPDRFPNLTFSSITATGFGLTSYIIGVERAYISRAEAANRVYHLLQFLWNLPQGEAATGVAGYKGFYYHFLGLDTGLRYKKVELSSIDTALLMAGVLSVRAYFDKDSDLERRIRHLATMLYERVEWDWMMTNEGTLSMGWHPEKGFINHKWEGYNEAMILYILAMGSPTFPIEAESWNKWCSTNEWYRFMEIEHTNFAPLFGHQYSHMYIDFRYIMDDYCNKVGIDYFENSIRATLANKNYCLSQQDQYQYYSDTLWGLTACDGLGDLMRNGKKYLGYAARGASRTYTVDDGTIAPTAVGGSIPFQPDLCLKTLESMWNTYSDELIGEYGFKDAFNLSYIEGEGNKKGWFDSDYVGIDQGPILIQLENYRSEMIWDLMKRDEAIINGLLKANFKGGWLDEPSMIK